MATNRRQDIAHGDVESARGMPLRRRPSTTTSHRAAGSVTTASHAQGHRALSYEALRDAYNVLRVAGLPLAVRLDEYREHLRRHHVKESTLEERVDRVRPFLAQLFGTEDAEDVPRAYRWPREAEAQPEAEYGVRYSDGRVERVNGANVLTSVITDSLNTGGAEIVAIDADGGTRPLDVMAAADSDAHEEKER